MPPWKSQRVQGQRQHDVGGQIGSSNGSASSISTSPFRLAKSAIGTSNGELPIELLSSPSRGLDTSDSSRDLTNEATQAKYRQYISQRLQAHSDKFGPLLNEVRKELFPLLLPGTQSVSRWSAGGVAGAALGSLQDILLLVRRLREGCVAAGRRDHFAVDVYALSTYLSLLIGDDVQLSSSLPRLLELVLNATSYGRHDVAQDIEAIVGKRDSFGSDTTLKPGHVASLYLLWLMESGGQASRLGGAQKSSRGPGGAWLQEKDRLVQALEGEEEQEDRRLVITENLHSAIVRGSIFRLRNISIKEDLSIWQRAFVRRSVERLREEVWVTLTKAYLHAPLDPYLFDEDKGGDDWLERVLMIDVEVMPPSEVSTSVKVSTPDAWDDPIDQVTSDLRKTTLMPDASTIQLRAHRLAAVFEAFGLPQSHANGFAYTGPLHKWSGRKVIQGGTTTLKLR